MGVYFRTRSLSLLEGKYLIDPDSYRHMRHIRQIAERGNLPKVDLMRKIPYGHRNTLQSEAFPWLIVQGFRLLRRFIPSLELRQAAVFYPVPVSMFAILILFLIGWRSFNLFAALLGSTALTSVPLFVKRTSVGVVDTDAVIISLFLLSLLFYISSLNGSIRQRAVYKLFSSLTLGALGLIWQGVGIGAVIIYGCEFILITSGKAKLKEGIVSAAGSMFYLAMLLIPDDTFRKISEPFSLIAIAPPLLLTMGYLAMSYPLKRWRWVPPAIALLLLVIPLLLRPYVLGNLFEHMLYPFGKDPIMMDIEELQRFDADNWWKEYGLFLSIGLSGFLFLIYREWWKAREALNRPYHHLVSLTMGISTMITARAFTSFFSSQPTWLGLLALIAPAVWTTAQVSYLFAKGRSERVVLVLVIWFLISFNLACTAVRFNLFLAPVLSLMSAFFLTETLSFLLGRKDPWFFLTFILTIIGWQLLLCDSDFVSIISNSAGLPMRARLMITLVPTLMLLGFILNRLINADLMGKLRQLLCFVFISFGLTAYVGALGLGIGQKGFAAGFIRPTPDVSSTRKAIEWLRSNSPKWAVIAADWDYGSSICELGRRATIIDEEQDVPTIRAFYRDVICGEDVGKALRFLREHKVTHLMLTLREIYMLDRIWRGAYPDKRLSHPLITPLMPESVTEVESNVHVQLSPEGRLNLRELAPELEREDEISQIEVDYQLMGKRPIVPSFPEIIIEGDKRGRIGIKELIMNDQQWYFPEAELDMTLVILTTPLEKEHPDSGIINRSFLLDRKARGFLSVNLFLNEEAGERFKLKYRDKENEVKIWEVSR